MVQQEGNRVRAAIEYREHERRTTGVIARVDVGLLIEQGLQSGDVARLRCPTQGDARGFRLALEGSHSRRL